MRLIRFVSTLLVSRPVWCNVVLLLLVAASLGRITHLRIDASTDGFIDEADPTKTDYDHFVDTFGSDVLTAVVVTPDTGDVFQHDTLALVDTLTGDIERLPGVMRVESLVTVKNIKSEEDAVLTDALVVDLPETDADLARIRDDAFRGPLIAGNVLSADGRHTMLQVFTQADLDRRAFLDGLEALLAKPHPGHTIYHVGAPRYDVTFNDYIRHDQLTLVPFAVAVIMLVLLLAFRAPMGPVLPLLTAALSIFAMLGFMAWMDLAVTAVSVIAPSVIIVVGCTEDVHLISAYLTLRREGLDRAAAVRATLEEGLLPIMLTSLTTILGFGVLAVSSIAVLREFGIICAFGLAANLVVTVVVAPLILLYAPEPRKLGAVDRNAPGARIPALVNRINSRRGGTVGLIALCCVALAVWGCLRVRVNNDPVGFFKQDAPIRRDFDQATADMGGVQTFYVVVETPADGAKTPDLLHRIENLQAEADGLGLFGKTLSAADFVKQLNRAFQNNPTAGIPADKNLVAQYLLLLEPEDVDRYINYDADKTCIMVRHGMSGSAEVKAALKQLDRLMQRHLNHYVDDGRVVPLRTYVSGKSVLLHRATDEMIMGQIKSLGLAMLVIFGIISALFLSLKAGLVAMVSNMVPILFNFGFMGWMGIPFNTGTCLVATIALGIAVDDTIHFMVHYQRGLRASGSARQALTETLHAEGRPMLVTSTALCLGFGVMSASPFLPTVHFGLLAALIMIYALLCDLFVNPLLLLRVQLITLWDFIGLHISRDVLGRSSLLRGLKPGEAKKLVLLGRLRQVRQDEVFLQQGAPGEEMFLLLEGRARVFSVAEDGREENLGMLESGNLLGEMALLGEGRRSASVAAVTPLQLLTIDARALRLVQRRDPRIALKVFVNISQELGKRVVAQNQKLLDRLSGR